MTKQELIDFEKDIASLYLQGQLPFLFHLSGGNEDQLLDIFKEIQDGDYVLSTHRNHYHALLHGIDPSVLKDRIINGRSMFVYDRSKNFFTSAIIGGTSAIAAGIALALKKKGSKKKVWCFVGDGTEDNGHLFEAARYVEGFDLPCTFIIEDNNRSVTTTTDERWGAARNPTWFSCVRKYVYDITYPHARVDGHVSNLIKPLTDAEYFPIRPNLDQPISFPNTENISYKDAVVRAMTNLGMSGNSFFIGYNVKNGNAMGTLNNVPDKFKIETPVAENLMTGLAIGMSFEGFKPVVYYERHDFMLVAADAIINHINHIERISHGEYTCPVILRAVVADASPFYSGPTHSQNFTEMFRSAVTFPIYEPKDGAHMSAAYELASASTRPAMIVEKKSLY